MKDSFDHAYASAAARYSDRPETHPRRGGQARPGRSRGGRDGDTVAGSRELRPLAGDILAVRLLESPRHDGGRAARDGSHLEECRRLRAWWSDDREAVDGTTLPRLARRCCESSRGRSRRPRRSRLRRKRPPSGTPSRSCAARRVVVEHFFEGRDLADVGAELGVTESRRASSRRGPSRSSRLSWGSINWAGRPPESDEVVVLASSVARSFPVRRGAWARELGVSKVVLSNRLTEAVGDTMAFLFFQFSEIPADLQLLISTKDKKYAERFDKLIWPALDRALDYVLEPAVLAMPYFGKEYKEKLTAYVEKYKKENSELFTRNPYGVPIGMRPWAGDEEVIRWAVTNYYLHEAFPQIIGPE